MQLLRKLSVKEVVGNVRDVMTTALKKGSTLPMEICQVYGIAAELFSGEGGSTGKYEGINGNFEAVNTLTGEEFSAYKCFLPQVGIDFVRSLLLGSDGKPVEFGVSIAIQEPTRENSQMSYEYVVKPIGSQERSSKIKALRERLSQS